MKRIRNLIDNVGLSSSPSQQNHNQSLKQSTAKTSSHTTSSLKAQVLQRQPLPPVTEDYSEDGMDNGVYEMKKLPADATQEIICEIFSRLQAHLGNISRKLSSAILENQQSYDKELQRVRDLEKTLQIAFSRCSNGQSHIMVSSQSSRTLQMLVRIQRRRNLSSLQLALNTIKTLEHTDVHLRQLMDEDRYPDAIQICLECCKVSTAYGHYSCIKDLYVKLQDTVEQIEEQMDEALSEVCDKFDDQTYTKLQLSYKLLGKRQIAIDQLLMHFTTCIHKSASKKLLEHAIKFSNESTFNLQKKSFTDLCKDIDSSNYIPCLMALCKTLVNILFCYQKVFVWHKTELSRTNSLQSAEIGVDQKYILQKLEKGRQRIWMDVQSRIKHILVGADISDFEYQQFIKVVSIINVFISVGAKFCGNSDSLSDNSSSFAADLQEPIYHLSLQYFHAYHRKCLDELHMFLTNEAWERCPVNRNFSVLKLPELKPFHAAARKDLVDSSARCRESDSELDDIFKESPVKLFDAVVQTKSGDQAEDGIFIRGADDVDDVQSDEELCGNEGPILTNSALNILRICGKYLSMCEVLKPISTDVVICMSNLFDYYLISIFHLFATHGAAGLQHSKKLAATLDRIRRELISSSTRSDGDCGSVREKIVLPTQSPIVSLDDRGSLFGFPSRMTAAESLLNLADQFKKLRPSLERILHSTQQAFLQQFYAQTVDACAEVRSLVYYAVSAGMLDYERVLCQIPMVNWDIRDIMSQHNKYVDDLLRQFEILKATLLHVLEGVPSSWDILKIIWEYSAKLCNYGFVEGYSNVKKCSNEGRALMQLDYQQFVSKLDELTGLSPIPGKSFVEAYLRAFYLSEEDFEAWKVNHQEYTEKQLSSLLSCISAAAANFGKKNKKQKMRAMLEDITGKKS